MAIKNIILREIFDSRGNPTIEAEVSSDENTARAAAPSGASVGKHEVPAFPRGGPGSAIKLFNSDYRKKFIGLEANYHEVDFALKAEDPTREKLGGNLSIALSLAVAKLHALDSEIDFYELFAQKFTLPYPLGNVIGGGVHAGEGSPEIQEFLCIAVGAKSFKNAALANSLVHKIAGEKLGQRAEFTRGRNDEGGWAPAIGNSEALETLSASCAKASNELGFEVRPALDMAASEFYDSEQKKYIYKGDEKTSDEQVDFVAALVNEYNLYYVEDPLEENDFEGFAKLNAKIGKKCLVVGDDLITTNEKRLREAISKKAVNSLIVKPNQIGSLMDTEKVINLAKQKKITPVISHRSGETTDSSIAHLAVGFSIPIIKTGILGGERLAKINELLRIEEKEKRARISKLKV